jgi:gamma-glutamyltranspeptidase/glutathione hydrolase
MRLADVLAPAIAYAENGYPLVARIPAAIETVKAFFLAEWPSSAAIYCPGGKVPKTGHLFRNPAIGATYRRVIREAEAAGGDREGQIEAARKAWYAGFVAEAIDKFCRTEIMDTSGRRHRGLLTGEDMARWEATVEAALTYDYKNYTVAKCGPWSQGPVLLQQLALLKGFDLAALDPFGAEYVHTIVECAKLAFADREAWYADPNFVDVPMQALLSPQYNDERRRLIGKTASHELRPGAPDGRPPRLYDGVQGEPGAYATGIGSPSAGIGEPTIGIGEPTMARDGEALVTANGQNRGDTVHIDVIDRWGNMISATPSGGWLQSSPAIPELGFQLNTRAQMFWLTDGLPTSMAPGRRPRTTLSPSFALKDGEPYMAFGTPGGDQQDQWSTLFFLRHVEHGLNLQEAIDAPAFHTEHMPSSFYPRGANPGKVALEGRMPAATVTALKKRGHIIQVGDDWSEGRLSAAAAERTQDGTVLKAGANPRGMQGYAIAR